ncbi:MAG: hypothetical protein K2L97_04000 [Muribaculaceae bacterium]|nr:hypothetical protein [Muribaculaceae bacterium]
MKIITSLILASWLAIAIAPAQTTKVATSNDVIKSSPADTVAVVETDSLSAVSAEVVTTEETNTPQLILKDGEWSLTYEGNEYLVSDLVEDSHFSKFFDEDDFMNENSGVWDSLKNRTGLAALTLILLFGLPWLAVIVGLIVILIYSLKRTRGRNELISRAIDQNYQLPDAFYLNTKNNGQNGGNNRNPRKFYSATTLIAIGLVLVIFAFYVDAEFFILAGGIPLLIGIGRLIGYYCVPNVPDQPLPGQHQPQYGPMPFDPTPGPVYNQHPRQYPAQPMQQPQCQPVPAPQSPVMPPMPPQPHSQTSPQESKDQTPTPPPYNPA